MTAKGELVARIAELSESLAAKSQPKPEDLATETNLTLPQIRILYFLSRDPKRITEVSRAHGVALPTPQTWSSDWSRRVWRSGCPTPMTDESHWLV